MITQTCSDYCPTTPPCALNWFASPCICMVSAGGVAPTVSAQQQPTQETRDRATHEEPRAERTTHERGRHKAEER